MCDRGRRRRCVNRARASLRHDDAPGRRRRRSLSGHWFHNGCGGRTGGCGYNFSRAGWRWRRRCRPRLCRSSSNHRWAHFCTRNCRSCRTGTGSQRTHFYPCHRRPGNHGTCRRLCGNGRRRGRWGDYNPRFLPGLGHDSPWSRRSGRRGTLTLSAKIGTTQAGSTEIRPGLPWLALCGRTLTSWLA